MKYLCVLFFIALGCAQGENQNDNPVINDVTVTEATVTSIGTPPSIGPEPPAPDNVTTTIPPTPPNVTTTTPTVPTTTPTPKPSPTTTKATTTPAPSPPTTAKTSTTASPKTTSAPPVSTTVPPPPRARTFDGPSFVGGIVLALGMVAIGFVAFKFYKARSEMNYHTL